MKTITRSPHGTGKRTVDVASIVVPDLWHIADAVKSGKGHTLGYAAGERILECWALCHDLLEEVRKA